MGSAFAIPSLHRPVPRRGQLHNGAHPSTERLIPEIFWEHPPHDRDSHGYHVGGRIPKIPGIHGQILNLRRREPEKPPGFIDPGGADGRGDHPGGPRGGPPRGYQRAAP